MKLLWFAISASLGSWCDRVSLVNHYLINILAWTYHIVDIPRIISVNRKKALRLLTLTLLLMASWTMGYVNAYSSQVTMNLNKTRDALLDQRAHLQERYDQIRAKIAELNQQLNVVDSYLRDTDRNIRDVDDALRRVN